MGVPLSRCDGNPLASSLIFGQRLDKTLVEEFTDPRALHAFLASGRYHVTYVSPMTDERVEVHYKVHDPMIDVSPNLNIFVARLLPVMRASNCTRNCNV